MGFLDANETALCAARIVGLQRLDDTQWSLAGHGSPPSLSSSFFFFSSHDTSCTDHFCGSKIAARVPDSDINANLPTALARDVRVLQALLMNCVAVKKALLFFFAALIAAQPLSQYKVSDIPT